MPAGGAFALLSLAAPMAAAHGAAAQPAPAALVGGRVVYEVKPGDTLASISARHAVATATLRELNPSMRADALTVGQPLVIDNTHIAIAHPAAPLVINIAQRQLDCPCRTWASTARTRRRASMHLRVTAAFACIRTTSRNCSSA